MNIENLDVQPEIANTLNLELTENEKVIFESSFPSSLFTNKGQPLAGLKNKIILTNLRLILYTGAGFFYLDLKEDIQNCVEVKRWLVFTTGYYFLVTLNRPVEYTDIRGKKYSTDGIRLEFNNVDRAKFKRIIGIM